MFTMVSCANRTARSHRSTLRAQTSLQIRARLPGHLICTRDGKFSAFHVMGGGTSAGQGTAVFSLNFFGAVTGSFVNVWGDVAGWW